jgi:hypothetical protein
MSSLRVKRLYPVINAQARVRMQVRRTVAGCTAVRVCLTAVGKRMENLPFTVSNSAIHRHAVCLWIL